MKKTSLTHPLKIQSVEVPGTRGRIGMTLCPGKVQKSALSGDWARDLDLDLKAIQDWGATTLVTLMEPHELKAFQVSELPERIPQGLAHVQLPIPDGGIPDGAWESAWEVVGANLRAKLRAGNHIVIHCRGGLGRTGTVAARLLVEFGMTPEEAIRAVRAARPGTIENSLQEGYVRRQRAVERPLVRPYHRIAPERASRFRGCLLGGAVGDALGAPVEFKDVSAIKTEFGPQGIRDLTPAYGRLGAITDDTQMTLFTAEGMIRAQVRGRLRGLSTISGVTGHAYQRWLVTQGHASRVKGLGLDGWLFGHKELFACRAPGNTCLSALQAVSTIGDGTGARNASKGCGGVMRAAPVGLYAVSLGHSAELAFEWGCEIAALTHGHPTGRLAAGAFAMMIADLAAGVGLREALQRTKVHLAGQRDHLETLTALEAAQRLAEGKVAPDKAIHQLGQGWVAEEALAIALYCSLTAPNFEEGVIRAVNITGDSDSTGAMTGNLLGALLGVHEIPDRWLTPLELRGCITEVADDLATLPEWKVSEFGFDSEEDKAEQDYWVQRYPGW